MAASRAWLHVEELPELLKWARVPQSRGNSKPKSLRAFSYWQVLDKSSLSSVSCCTTQAQRAWMVWFSWYVALCVECGRMIYDSLSCKDRRSHFTIARETIIPWPQTQRQSYQQYLGEECAIVRACSHNIFYCYLLISISFMETKFLGKLGAWVQIILAGDQTKLPNIYSTYF